MSWPLLLQNRVSQSQHYRYTGAGCLCCECCVHSCLQLTGCQWGLPFPQVWQNISGCCQMSPGGHSVSHLRNTGFTFSDTPWMSLSGWSPFYLSAFKFDMHFTVEYGNIPMIWVFPDVGLHPLRICCVDKWLIFCPHVPSGSLCVVW